jgi:hypothetical protein
MTNAVIDTLSHRRFETYLVVAGFDHDRALALYIWNAQLGAAFHVPIQAVEVALRNRINHALVAQFGPDWWDKQFISIIDRERVDDLETVKKRINRRQLTLETDQIVAGLSFGFWVGMLQSRYNPRLWGAHLRTSFPFLPMTESRQSLAVRGREIAGLRNRISHHEPLLKTDAMKSYGEIMKMIGWLCPQTAVWIRPHCDVPKVVRQKP